MNSQISSEQIQAFDSNRKRVPINIGSHVKHRDKIYRITQVVDFNSIIAVEVESGHSKIIPISELTPVDEGDLTLSQELTEIADRDWKEVERRYAIIRPLLDKNFIGRDEARKLAKEAGIHTATLYRWVKRFQATGSGLSLLPRKRGWRTGRSRISASTEAIIKEVIDNFYLTRQRPTEQKAVTEVIRLCHESNLKPPSSNTIRKRLRQIPEWDRLYKRGFKEKAKNKFLPAPGSFPNADYPLAVVQVDHTLVDIILVDDTYRKPIGRPWLTLAMDVFSRMILGYYLSFDPPSETSIAICVAHAILPKDEWLTIHKIDAKWPVWGIPKTIHVDNGSDFRSNNFRQSCLAYGINIEFRPVKQPRYGGNIERALGSILHEIHDLPGTTFSSVKEKEGYDSEKRATMTMAEFETWLVTFICKIYHERLHNGIGTSPRRKWEIGIFGNSEVQGIGLPPRLSDRRSVLLDFLPCFRRTIQRSGVTIEGLTYYAESLRPWINAENPNNPGEKREFIFRRDPRDISTVWFKDPKLQCYFNIPLANQSLPSMSAWEYKLAKEKLSKEGIKSKTEVQILRAIKELRNQVEESKQKTKKARRQSQRNLEYKRRAQLDAPVQNQIQEQSIGEKDCSLNDLLDDNVIAFEDIK